ncbi:GNAT family N-acetyltransferase [Lacticaseibacillus nasuensis]|uniref:N-acetyltransferase domain-containing protein n=1 Tax=Lacticaseibacillus nasuensis JCM 17158 TaxID=1291734 RepID=A0A0R1K127_9LACO|nr:N-acetyltransferase [Lacticaseibacillus nasuensis]KRK73858.1 hypothetical protein FD02_GL001688 [Lacticaseibacillus nasuensis JCM 17158]
MRITPTKPSQFIASQAVVTAAFAKAAHHDGTEGELVAKLRDSPHYRADYDAVVSDDAGRIVGCALLSPARVGTTAILVLAPVAIAPAFQGQGLGSALINYLCVQAGENSAAAISVLGDPAYYSRFGFKLAERFGITAPIPHSAPYLQIRPLRANALATITGTIQYDPAFGLGE